MANMSKAALETAIRNKFLDEIRKVVSESYDYDIRPISASELMVPVVDDEGNEKYVLIKVSIPRGTRNGEGGYTPYDGYAAAEEWEQTLAEKANKVAARKEKAERAEKEKERKRAAKKTIKKLNTEGLQAMIHAPNPDDEKDDDNQYLPGEVTV
jgi:hypothetical protein